MWAGLSAPVVRATDGLLRAREVSPEARRVRAERWSARALGGLKRWTDLFGHPGHPSDTEWVCVMEEFDQKLREKASS